MLDCVSGRRNVKFASLATSRNPSVACAEATILTDAVEPANSMLHISTGRSEMCNAMPARWCVLFRLPHHPSISFCQLCSRGFREANALYLSSRRLCAVGITVASYLCLNDLREGFKAFCCRAREGPNCQVGQWTVKGARCKVTAYSLTKFAAGVTPPPHLSHACASLTALFAEKRCRLQTAAG